MLSAIANLAVMSVIATATAVQVSGAWTLTFDPDFSGTHGTTAACSFAQKDDALTGTCAGDAPVTGEVTGRTVHFQIPTGLKNEITVTFEGVLDQSDSSIAGSWRLVDEAGKRDGKFTLKRR